MRCSQDVNHDIAAAARPFVDLEDGERDENIDDNAEALWTGDSLETNARLNEDEQHFMLPLHLVPAQVPQPPLGIEETIEYVQYHRRHRSIHVEEQQLGIETIPVLPSVIFFRRIGPTTRLRYDVDILTVKGEKYVRLDETHFLYAVSVNQLFQRGNLANVTSRQAPYAHWQAYRDAGRPEILFELYPKGQYAYSPETARRKKPPQEFRPACDECGRVLLNSYKSPLKYSEVMPFTISTEIEGWEMEAICRLDPDICHQDFLDRMLPDADLGGKVRPTKGTLNHRRRRDRMRMRILPWPLPRQLSYSDQQVVKQLDPWQLENNTTRSLRDLSRKEIEMHEAIMYGGHFERSGSSKALNDRARLEQMKVNLRLVRTKFADESEEVQTLTERVVILLKKMEGV